MTVWALRDFLAAIDDAGIPDTATLIADHNDSTRHFIGLRIRHTFVVSEAPSEAAELKAEPNPPKEN